MPRLKQRKVGRPAADVFSVAEVATLLEIPERLVRARARLSFFPGAKCLGDNEWEIPASGLRVALMRRIEPMFSVRDAAKSLALTYKQLWNVTGKVQSVDAPLPEGKVIRAVPLDFVTTVLWRIPESELIRWQSALEGGAL